MLWLGIIIGIVIGFILGIITVQKLLYYIGEHPEQMEQLVSQAVGQVVTKLTKDVLDQLNNKYARIPSQYKTNNPFMTNAIDIAVQSTVADSGKIYEI